MLHGCRGLEHHGFVYDIAWLGCVVGEVVHCALRIGGHHRGLGVARFLCLIRLAIISLIDLGIMLWLHQLRRILFDLIEIVLVQWPRLSNVLGHLGNRRDTHKLQLLSHLLDGIFGLLHLGLLFLDKLLLLGSVGVELLDLGRSLALGVDFRLLLALGSEEHRHRDLSCLPMGRPARKLRRHFVPLLGPAVLDEVFQCGAVFTQGVILSIFLGLVVITELEHDLILPGEDLELEGFVELRPVLYAASCDRCDILLSSLLVFSIPELDVGINKFHVLGLLAEDRFDYCDLQEAYFFQHFR